MKKTFFLLSALQLLFSCSGDSDVQPTLEEGYPHEWVFTKDESSIPQDPSVAQYTYIYTNKYAMFRDEVLKSYPLEDLVEEEHCLFYVAEAQSSSGKTCYNIHLNSDRERVLSVGLSSNKEEVHLKITTFTVDDDDEADYEKFYIHRMPDVGGVRTVAIESVRMPGWYISDSPPGFNYAANVVTLQEEKSPENAPKWQCRGVK